MATSINVQYQKKNYTLEFSRQSVRQLEANGFVLDQVGDKPVTFIPMLVFGAFAKHHKGISRKLVDEIYKNIVDKFGDDEKNGFVQTLLEMYAETVNSLTGGENADGEEGNAATWKVNKV